MIEFTMKSCGSESCFVTFWLLMTTEIFKLPVSLCVVFGNLWIEGICVSFEVIKFADQSFSWYYVVIILVNIESIQSYHFHFSSNNLFVLNPTHQTSMKCIFSKNQLWFYLLVSISLISSWISVIFLGSLCLAYFYFAYSFKNVSDASWGYWLESLSLI